MKKVKRCALQTGHGGACLMVKTTVRDLILGECPKGHATGKG